MKTTAGPSGLAELGFSEEQTDQLAQSAFRQKRAIGNAPRDSNLIDVTNVFASSRSYW